MLWWYIGHFQYNLRTYGKHLDFHDYLNVNLVLKKMNGKKYMGLAIYIFFDNRIKSWNGNKEIMSEIEVIDILQQPHPPPHG